MIEIRELAPAEHPDSEELRKLLMPGTRLFGAFEDGVLSMVLGAYSAVVLDPLWVPPDHRTRNPLDTDRALANGRLLISLWEGVMVHLQHIGAKVVFGIGNDARPGVLRMLQRIGAYEFVGRRLFMLPPGLFTPPPGPQGEL